MRTWIITSNRRKVFDLKKYFQNTGSNQIDWRTYNRNNISTGDTVFIYSTAPDCRLRYKMKVVRTDISGNEYKDDQPYWKNGLESDNNAYENYKQTNTFFRMELVEVLEENDKYKLKKLKEFGFNPRKPITELDSKIKL